MHKNSTNILNYIKENGPLSCADFMQLCLYHPEFGYYTTTNLLGEQGDFITAPELTPVFGELICLWVVNTWEQLGCPAEWTLAELGPGHGTLMSDVLRVCRKVAPSSMSCCSVALVETSPSLTKIQQQTLAEENIEWVTDINQVDNTWPTIVIGNEFLDAFPVQQWHHQGGGQYVERGVMADGNELHFTLLKESTATFESEAEIVETSTTADWLAQFKAHFADTPLASLFIDYGAAPKTPFTEKDTLQAIHQHQKVDALAHPGAADLTTQVNFTAVKEALGDTCYGPMAQAVFLTNLGLPIRAAQIHAKLDDAGRQDLEQRLHRLMALDEMGELFKAFCYVQNCDVEPAGFGG